MIYTGRHFKAAEALAIGLADKVVPAEDLLAAAMEYAALLAKGATVAIGAAKRAINATLGSSMEDGLEVEAAGFTGLPHHRGRPGGPGRLPGEAGGRLSRGGEPGRRRPGRRQRSEELLVAATWRRAALDGNQGEASTAASRWRTGW